MKNKVVEKKIKAKPKSKINVVNIKMTDANRDIMMAKALRFTRGNLSAWVRHAARNYVPKKGERIKLKA